MTAYNILSIYSEDKKGLLGQILNLLNRRNYEVHSLNVSRTDIHEIVLITVEVVIPLEEVHKVVLKLEKIIEIFKVLTFGPGELSLNKIGFYRVSLQIMNEAFWPNMQRYGAAICQFLDETLIIRKTGTDADLSELYNLLEGQYLLSFCKSALVAEQSMIDLNECMI